VVFAAPEHTQFAFLNSAHHEIRLANLNDLRALVRAIGVDYSARIRGVVKSDLLEYVADQWDAEDPSWRRFCGDHPKWMKEVVDKVHRKRAAARRKGSSG